MIAWGALPWDEGYSLSSTDPCGILATSVADFANCGNLNVCPRFAIHESSTEYQMTNEGLRVQLPLRSPWTTEERRGRKYVAVLDCFSRQDPSRRIAIPIQKVKRHLRLKRMFSGVYGDIHVDDGDVFIRTGRALLLSDIAPNAPPSDVAAHQRPSSFRRSSMIDFPRHYRYDVKYVHPWFKVEKDSYTLEPTSLRIELRPPGEAFDMNVRSPYDCGIVEHCVVYWTLLIDMLTNIISGRMPFARLRIRLDSILLCVQLEKDNHVGNSTESASFIVFLAIAPYIPSKAYYVLGMQCRMAPLSEGSLQMQPVHPTGLSHALVGYRSLSVANETIKVHDLHVPDNSNYQEESVLFKVDVRNKGCPRQKFLGLQQLRTFTQLVLGFLDRYRFLVLLFVVYGIVVFILSYGSRDVHSLYLAVWTLCFMPIIYEVRRDRAFTFPNLGTFEEIVNQSILLIVGVAMVLYSALHAL